LRIEKTLIVTIYCPVRALIHGVNHVNYPIFPRFDGHVMMFPPVEEEEEEGQHDE